ncbi:MAG: zinc ribbon domain-containing protein [Deltaproteobacteria bacterium]|nr:zinc ribbon domain-containing protein [Deltaproteobacteria bacterium]
MPIYEYKCLQCDHQFEKLQKFSDSLITNCPKCSGPVKKLVSHTSFQLKGSGWYLTDYARKNIPDSSKGEKGSSKIEKDSPAPSKDTAGESKASSTAKAGKE